MTFGVKDLGSDDWSPQGSGNGFAVGNPLALPDIAEHFRAQSIAAGAIASWLGRNAAYTLAQPTGADQPVNTAAQINNKASVIYDGVNDSLDTGPSSIVIAQPWEVWLLFKQITYIASSFLFEMGNTTLGTYGFFSSSTNLRIISGSSTFNCTISAAGWNLLRIQSAAGANASSITVNNGAPIVGTMTLGTQRLILGSKADGTTNSNVSIPEVAIVKDKLTADEVTMMLNYHRNYNGLTL